MPPTQHNQFVRIGTLTCLVPVITGQSLVDITGSPIQYAPTQFSFKWRDTIRPLSVYWHTAKLMQFALSSQGPTLRSSTVFLQCVFLFILLIRLLR